MNVRELYSKFSIENNVALVTGAGRGLGKEIALALASAGADTCLVARTRAQLEETAIEIENTGRKAMVLPMDISNSADVDRLVSETESCFGPIDILVNNAGMARNKPLVDMSDNDWQAVMRVNLDAAFFLSRAVGRNMIGRKKGKIINIGSILGLLGYQGFSSYATSKAALLHLTRTLALEWAQHNINVNALAPGWFLTDMNREAMSDEKFQSRTLKRIPLRRFGKVSEIGPIVVFLASPASDFMTGSVIVMDGGEHINW